MASILLNIVGIWSSQFQCNYLENRKFFLNFYFHLWNLHQILKILKKKMMVIANVFPKLRTVENFVTLLSKKRPLWTPLKSEHAKVSGIVAKSHWERFYHVFSLFWGKVDLENVSPRVRWNVRVFVSTLTVDGMSPVQYCENLQLPIQMQVSEKRKTFSQFFVPYLDSTSSFTHFEKNDDGHS